MVRRPGTKTVRPPKDIGPNETVHVPLGQLTGGPKNKKGYLRKHMPFQAVVVDSYLASVRLRASVDGTDYDPVPTNSARTFDSVPVEAVYLKNPDGSATLQKEDIELILFTSEETVAREQAAQNPQFSGRQLLSDLIPGVE